MAVEFPPSVRRIPDRRAITAVEHIEDLIDAIRVIEAAYDQNGDMEVGLAIGKVCADQAEKALPNLRGEE